MIMPNIYNNIFFSKIQSNLDKYSFLISQKLLEKYFKKYFTKFNTYFQYYKICIKKYLKPQTAPCVVRFLIVCLSNIY